MTVARRVLTVALATALAVMAFAQAPRDSDPPPLGKLVDLGGRRLHAICSGTQSPAVIIESGAGAFSLDWSLVQPDIATFARVISYDRAGYAWSDRGPTQDTIEETIDDLQLLLRKEGVQGPYVMVGASLGSLYIRAFQRRFPDQVAGMVFVDGSHDEAITFMVDGNPTPISHLSAEELQAAYDAYQREAPQPRVGAADQEPLNHLSAELQLVRQWAMTKLIADVGLLPKGAAAAESWRQEFAALGRQRTESAHPLGDLPLLVLERTQGSSELWHRQQVELAGLSSAGRLISVKESGHMIHLYQPQAVIEAIRDVVETVRRKQTATPRPIQEDQ